MQETQARELLNEKRQRLKDAKSIHKKADRAWREAHAQNKAIHEKAELIALGEYNKAIEPFLQTYRIAWAKAIDEDRIRFIKHVAPLEDYERECYKELLGARQALQEAGGWDG